MPARPKTRRESAKKAAATKAGKAAEAGIKAARNDAITDSDINRIRRIAMEQGPDQYYALRWLYMRGLLPEGVVVARSTMPTKIWKPSRL